MFRDTCTVGGSIKKSKKSIYYKSHESCNPRRGECTVIQKSQRAFHDANNGVGYTGVCFITIC